MMKQLGFSLIELMIVTVIIAILAAIAYPAYTSHIVETRRTDAQKSLLDLYARMERYYAETNTYATATLNTGAATDIGTGGSTAGVETSADGFYELAIQAQNATSFTLTATPQGSQATEDTLCGTLSLNSLGVKGQSGSGTTDECWR